MAPLAKSAILLSCSDFAASRPLNDGLIGAVARHREESASDYSRPESISLRGIRQAEGEIEDAEFVGRSSGVHHGFPSSRNPVEQQKKRGDRSGEIEDELHDVGPDHGFHTAFEGIDEHKPHDQEDRSALFRPKRYLHDKRDGGDAHTFRESASDEECRSRDRLTLAPNRLSISW